LLFVEKVGETYWLTDVFIKKPLSFFKNFFLSVYF